MKELRHIFPSYRKQPLDLHCNSVDWFLNDGKICLNWVDLDIISKSSNKLQRKIAK